MSLDALMRPRSIAILGASERPSIGRAIVEGLDRLGFPGKVYLVNPSHSRILGRRCYASILELPEAPAAVAFCVGATRASDAMRQCAQRGVGAAVIYDAGFAERGDEGRALQEQIAQLCREVGISLCGPNGMGILNVHGRSSTYMQEVRDPSRLAGNVGLLSQSGSICIAMLSDVRRFGFSYVISSGNEAVVSASDYLDQLIDDPNTAIIAAFLETVRDPERFVACLDRAAAVSKPVVVLKVGQSERARHAVSSHTGGLAGESRIFSEVLRAHRAVEVSDLDEMTEVLAAAQSNRRPRGRRFGVVTSSGGKAELILDIADKHGLDLPPLSPDARREAARVIGPISGDGNPLDAWGNGDFATNFAHALKVVGECPQYDVVVLSADTADGDPMGQPDRGLRYGQILVRSAEGHHKPHYLLSMRSGVVAQSLVDLLAQYGIPVIGGPRQGLAAIGKLSQSHDPLRPFHVDETAGPGQLLAGYLNRTAINEFDAKQVLSAAGLPASREAPVASLDEALAAAERIGFPVVLKVVSDDIPHKSELGLVELSLGTPEALAVAWKRQTAILPRALPQPASAYLHVVQEMVTGGIEVMTGITRDADFGLFMAFGLGGVAVEVLDDVVLRKLPLRQGDAAEMVSAIRGAPLLRGARTSRPYDIDGLIGCLEAFAAFAWAERHHILEIDLNPIIVLPEGRGCRIVDALIVPRKQEER